MPIWDIIDRIKHTEEQPISGPWRVKCTREQRRFDFLKRFFKLLPHLIVDRDYAHTNPSSKHTQTTRNETPSRYSIFRPRDLWRRMTLGFFVLCVFVDSLTTRVIRIQISSFTHTRRAKKHPLAYKWWFFDVHYTKLISWILYTRGVCLPKDERFVVVHRRRRQHKKKPSDLLQIQVNALHTFGRIAKNTLFASRSSINYIYFRLHKLLAALATRWTPDLRRFIYLKVHASQISREATTSATFIIFL